MPQNDFPWTGGEAPSWDDIKDKPTTFAPPAATDTVVGGVLQGVAVADAAGDAPTAEEYDALLGALRDAGIIATA